MGEQIRVLHLSSESTWRGGEQQIIYLVEETRKLGIDAIVGCKAGSEVENYCRENDLPYYSLAFKSAYDFSTAREINKIVEIEGIDLVQTHTSKSHTMSVIAGLIGLDVPQIMTRRVDFPVKDNWFSRFKYNYSKIARIICISATIRRITEPDIKDKSKLVTIHSGVDRDRFLPFKDSQWLRENYKITSDTIIIGNTSAISDQKDYPTFVATAETILKQRDDVHFFIVGDGPDKERIVELIKKKGLEKKITLTGFKKNIKEILPSLDIFLFTSQTEGLGTSVLDAMAAGVPIVATAAGGVSEMVRNEENGFLVKVKDVKALAMNVTRLIDDPTLGEKFTQGAQQTVANFSKEKTAARTVDLYKEILKEKGHSFE
ncbi:MAG: glycosyltransferase family 4 protein [Cyclobacteriaceae bacterium]